MSDKVYWTTKDSRKISVDDMDVTHLRNTLKMIIRNSQRVKTPRAFQLNGDMAQEFHDSHDNEYDFLPDINS